MKLILWIVGVVLVLVGALWFLQGINVIPVGMMAGQPLYTILGLIVAVIGVVLIVFANRRFGGVKMAKSPAKRDQ
jgi:protein-S-isoprenylcysteine O-methyltransferase Ste14